MEEGVGPKQQKLLRLAGYVFVPRHKRMTKGGMIDVDAYQRKISNMNELNADERAARAKAGIVTANENIIGGVPPTIPPPPDVMFKRAGRAREAELEAAKAKYRTPAENMSQKADKAGFYDPGQVAAATTPDVLAGHPKHAQFEKPYYIEKPKWFAVVRKSDGEIVHATEDPTDALDEAINYGDMDESTMAVYAVDERGVGTLGSKYSPGQSNDDVRFAGAKQVQLAHKLGREVVALAGTRVWIPPHKSTSKSGKVVDVDGHWREITANAPMTDDEAKAIKAKAREILGPDLKQGMKSPKLKMERRLAEIEAVNKTAPKVKKADLKGKTLKELYKMKGDVDLDTAEFEAVYQEILEREKNPADVGGKARKPKEESMDDIFERLDLDNRSLDELEDMRDNQPLEMMELEAVNIAIEEAQNEEEGTETARSAPKEGKGERPKGKFTEAEVAKDKVGEVAKLIDATVEGPGSVDEVWSVFDGTILAEKFNPELKLIRERFEDKNADEFNDREWLALKLEGIVKKLQGLSS